jgi:outer membrane beta-barrel protein
MRHAFRTLALVLCLSAVTARAQTSEQEAGDVSEVDRDRGPLRERISPVSGKLFSKAGRFELSPSATASLADPFFSKYIFGGALTYHLTEWLGVGVRGGYSLPTISGAAQVCTTETTSAGAVRGCRTPTVAELNGRAPGQITLLGGVDLQLSPVYGKISVLAERFLHFDLYGVGGLGVVQYVAPTAAGGAAPQIAVGFNVGAGMRFVVSRWITVRFELRDLIYPEYVQPLPAVSQRHQLLFELGVSLFFPTSPGES